MTSVNQRLCFLSVRAHTTLSTLQKWPSFFFFWTDQTFLQFLLPPSDVLTQRSLRGLKVGHDCTLCLQLPNGNITTPKPPLSFRFISRVLKATKCNSADGFRCTHLRHSATSNFRGVDRKQNMYYEVGGLSPVNYRLSTGEEEKLPECNLLRSGPSPCFALLSSIDGLAGRSGGGRNLKSYFPHSQSLTRMHDKASCQQGQE